jgi:hypothetical protein
MRPKWGWRGWLESTSALYAYFRGNEYPMRHAEALYEAAKMAWRWP